MDLTFGEMKFTGTHKLSYRELDERKFLHLYCVPLLNTRSDVLFI